jgi:hypothetical protein
MYSGHQERCWLALMLMQQIALGRKNCLFKGSVTAGEQAAMLTKLTISALRNYLHVRVYI